MDLLRAWVAAILAYFAADILASMATMSLLRSRAADAPAGEAYLWAILGVDFLVLLLATTAGGLAYPRHPERPRWRYLLGILAVPAAFAAYQSARIYPAFHLLGGAWHLLAAIAALYASAIALGCALVWVVRRLRSADLHLTRHTAR